MSTSKCSVALETYHGASTNILRILNWSQFLVTASDVRVRFPALPDFLRSSESGTGSTQPREYNWGVTSKKK
jgi:hypothetical protein